MLYTNIFCIFACFFFVLVLFSCTDRGRGPFAAALIKIALINNSSNNTFPMAILRANIFYFTIAPRRSKTKKKEIIMFIGTQVWAPTLVPSIAPRCLWDLRVRPCFAVSLPAISLPHACTSTWGIGYGRYFLLAFFFFKFHSRSRYYSLGRQRRLHLLGLSGEPRVREPGKKGLASPHLTSRNHDGPPLLFYIFFFIFSFLLF